MMSTKKQFSFCHFMDFAAFTLISVIGFLSGIFGNEFIQHPARPVLMLVIFSLFFVISKPEFYLLYDPADKLNKVCVLFFVYCNIYIVFSVLNFQRMFRIDLGYYRTLIPRQAYFVYYGFLIGSVVYYLAKEKTSSLTLFHGYSAFLMAMCIGLFRPVTGYSLIIFFLVFVGILRSQNKWYFWIPLILLSYFKFMPEASTGKLIFYLFLLMNLFGNFIIRMVKHWCIGLLIATIIYLSVFGNLRSIKKIDGNSWVRLEFWKSNFTTCISTGFLGVGFGTGYFENDIYSKVGWTGFGAAIDHPLVNSLPGNRYFNTLYVIAQHNSFVNIIFRLGGIGFFLFMSMNLGLFVRLRNLYYSVSSERYRHIIRCMIAGLGASILVIFLNPGLESPYTLLTYIIMFCSALGYSSRLNRFLLSGSVLDEDSYST